MMKILNNKAVFLLVFHFLILHYSFVVVYRRMKFHVKIRKGVVVMEVLISNNNVLNIATLQQKMETVVFDYIDSTQNWPIAYKKLNELFTQTVNYFNQYVATHDGQLPKVNTYWSLYLSIASQLIYFTALAKLNAEVVQGEQLKEDVAKAYKVALNCLPNRTSEESEQFLEEVVKSYAALTGETIAVEPCKAEQCMETFSVFTKKWAK